MNGDEDLTNVWPKACSCGSMYERHEWDKLHNIGVHDNSMIGFPNLELRKCKSCLTTLSIAMYPSENGYT